MSEVFKSLGEFLSESYLSLTETLPLFLQKFIAFFILAIIIVVYAFIVWRFYKSVSKKDILGLDLNKYNESKHPIITKIYAGGLYLAEYIIIAPIVIFLWFALLTLLLVAITEGIPTSTIILISALMMAVIRIISYSSRDLSQDIAKIVPLTLLATSFLTPNFFSVERILMTFKEIPTVIGDIGIYFLFIVFLEIILRLFDFFFSITGVNLPTRTKEED